MIKLEKAPKMITKEEEEAFFGTSAEPVFGGGRGKNSLRGLTVDGKILAEKIVEGYTKNISGFAVYVTANGDLTMTRPKRGEAIEIYRTEGNFCWKINHAIHARLIDEYEALSIAWDQLSALYGHEGEEWAINSDLNFIFQGV